MTLSLRESHIPIIILNITVMKSEIRQEMFVTLTLQYILIIKVETFNSYKEICI